MQLLGDRPWFKFWPKGVPRHIDYPEIPLFELLSDTARKYRDNLAFSCREYRLTYAELDIATSKLAAYLNEQGIEKGDSVLVFLPNGFEFVIGYFGILKAGGIVSPANPIYKGEELRHQLNDSQATAIITDGNSYPVVKEIKDETRLKTIILTDLEGIEEAVSLRKILTRYQPSPPTLDLKPKEDTAAEVATTIRKVTSLPMLVKLTANTSDIAKVAMCMFTRSLALDWAPFGINVNAIGPGSFYTKLSTAYRNPKLREKMVATIPLGRMGDVDEVGLLAVYLASGASDWITGQTIFIDGGELIFQPLIEIYSLQFDLSTPRKEWQNEKNR